MLFFCNAIALQAQRVVHQQSLYWIRYQNMLIFSPKISWTNDFDNRRFFSPDVEHQFIFHSRLHYRQDRWDFGTGITSSWVFAQRPELGYDHSVNELRPVVEASYELPLGKVLIQNRIRFDNRFFQEDPDKSVFEESFYVLRFRYRAQVRFALKKNETNETLIGLRIADEIMFNNTKNTFDQNRIYASADFYLTKKLTAETGYIYIFQQRFGTEQFFERHVVRLSLIHRIALH